MGGILVISKGNITPHPLDYIIEIMDPPLLLALGLYWLSTRDGNKLNLDRVLMDPDTKPFSWNRSGFDPGPTGLENDDPDPDNVDPTDACGFLVSVWRVY